MAHGRVIEPFDLVTCDGHRRDHGQDFRREADAQGDGKEQCLEGVPPERDADEQNEQHEDDRRAEDETAEPSEPALELALRLRVADPGGDARRRLSAALCSARLRCRSR